MRFNLKQNSLKQYENITKDFQANRLTTNMIKSLIPRKAGGLKVQNDLLIKSGKSGYPENN